MEHAHRHLRPDLFASIQRAPEARMVSVLEVTFRRGEGCCEDDPVRMVQAFYSLEGVLLAEHELGSAVGIKATAEHVAEVKPA